ncbi:MAG: nucleotidyltransferase family protein [Vicinamibacteria bacterium]
MNVVAVVLAAGEGRRMGGPKALVRLQGTTFVERCVETMRRPGVTEVLVVVGPLRERVAALLPGVTCVPNPRAADGMLGSILCGLEAAEERAAGAVLLHPVDHPLVDAATVDRVVQALVNGARIAVPSRDGRRGHPGGFGRAAWPALREAPPSRGARAVLADHPDWIVHVEGDDGSVAGIDTPEDYARLVGTPP